MAAETATPISEVNGNGSHKSGSIALSVALEANDMEHVPAILKGIEEAGKQLLVDDSATRLNLLERAHDLVRALETPRETMIKHCWAEPNVMMALFVCKSRGILELLAEHGGSPKLAKDLAVRSGVDPPLMSRILKHLAAMGYIKETGVDEYQPTNFAKALTIPIIGDAYLVVENLTLEAFVAMPKWLAEHDYQTPTSMLDGAFQTAHKTKLDFFSYAFANPPFGEQFNHHMSGYRLGRPSWMDSDFYPVQDRLVKAAPISADDVLLVDIGGGLGHDLAEFQEKHPNTPGRLILQDFLTIEQVKDLHPRIECMKYDFHTEQPVKGARAYYMHSVLHDWPDDVCASILTRVREAMRPGYSKLLINENVIPSTGADWQATALDLTVMALLSAKERTQADWEKLLAQNGFVIRGIWNTKKLNGVESLIECELT